MIIHFFKYPLEITLSEYRDFEERLILIEDKISAYEMVERVAKNQLGKFAKDDVQKHCPTLARQPNRLKVPVPHSYRSPVNRTPVKL